MAARTPFSKAPTTVLHNLAVNRFEMDFYNRSISEFNKGGHRVAEFFPFMARLYENRFRTVPNLIATPPVAVEKTD